MYDGSYHTYLEILRSKEEKFSLFGKLLLSTIAVFLVFASFLSAFSIYQYKKETPLRSQYSYLINAQNGVLQTSNSLDEIVILFNVQGEKTIAIDSLKDEKNTSDGYLIYLSQLQKNKTKIESISQNTKFQKDAIENAKADESMEELKKQTISYYESALDSLEKLKADHQFFINIHMGLGPSLYLPVVSNETVWQTQNREEIKNYYTKMKDEAGLAFENLTKVEAEGDYKVYLDHQLKYLETLVNLSSSTITALDIQSKSEEAELEQIEAAYDLSVKSKNALETTSSEILAQKLKLVDAANNIAQLVPVKFQQNSLNNTIGESINSLSYSNSLSSKVQTLVKEFSPLQTYLKL